MKEIRKDFYALKPICKYIECQLNTFRKECNFTDEELEFFNLKAKKKSIVQICMEMHISRTKYYSLLNSVEEKMIEVDKIYKI